MKQIQYTLTIFFVVFIIVSCQYDNEEALYPSSSPCDTTNVTFTGTITRILQNNCLSCHSHSAAPSSGGNIPLETHADVRAQIAAVEGAINYTGNYSRMPKNGGKLNACSLKQFDIWIRLGTPNK